jgi:phage terminase small subunit
MTPSQRVFADEYIKTRNATRAYLAAYPKCKSENSAGVSAKALLRNPKIIEYIDAELEKMHNATIADAAEIMSFYTCVMRGEKGEVLIDNRGDEHEVPSRMSDRLSAADKLAKMLGADKKPEGGNSATNELLQSLLDLERQAHYD